MAYTDPSFEARRAQIIKGATPSPVSSGGSFSSPSTGGFVDQSFEARRKQIYSQPAPPAPAPVISSTPTPAPQTPNFLQGAQTGITSALKGIGDFFSGVEKKIAGYFTPAGGKPQPITPYNVQPIKVPELSETQIKSISTLKVGQKIPGFDLGPAKESASSAQLTPEARQKAQNTLDAIFEKSNQFFGPIGDAIKSKASEIYNNPIENIVPGGNLLKYIEKERPDVYKKIQDNPLYKFEEAGIQGIIQGALRVYANWNPDVQTFLDKELEAVGTKGEGEIVGNTIGNVVGTIGSFVLGGEVAAALKLGRIALPASFAVLGQTSLPSSTPIEARARNLIIDTVTGTFLEYIKPLQNLSKLGTFEKGVEYTKQLTKSMTALSAQTYLDARSVGASDEQAKEMVKDSLIILLGIHGAMIAAKAGSYAVQSKFKEGSAVFTPDQARSTVVGSNLENTELGKTIMKWAMDAEVQGKNLQIDMTAAKKSKVAGVLNLKTPNGIAITKIELVDATQQPKIGSAGKTAEPPKAPETPPVVPESGKPVPETKAPVPAEPPVVPEKAGSVPEAEIKKVASNLIKNNPGLSQTEAEAMAKDVIAGRPEAKPVPPEMKAIIRIPEEFRSPSEEKAFTKIDKDPVQVVKDYEEAFGNEVSPDLALTQLDGYEGHNAGEFSRASGLIKSLVYDDLIRTQKGERNNTVLFTAGGPGSGKTSSVQGSIDPTGEHPVKDKYSIIVDTTFSNNSAPKDIEKALKNGYKVDLAFVFRDPVAAWEQGALPRIGEEGRVVSEGYFIQAHQDAQKNIVKAYNKYKDNPNVDFIFIENTADRSSPEISFDKVKEYLYNKGEVASAITRATNEAYETGKITKKQYEAATADRAGIGAGFTSELSSKSRQQVQVGEKAQLQATGEVIIPEERTFYRGGGQGSMPKEGTARDVVSYEQDELGNADVVGEPGVDLTQVPAKNLVWVTETPEQASDYGTVSPITLDHYSIVARDGQGGLLINSRPSVESSIQEAIPANVGGGAEQKSAWSPERSPRELTIAPSVAETPEEIASEFKRLGLPESVLKFSSSKTPIEAIAGGGKQYAYQRPAIGKAEFKILVDNSPELQKNPVMVVDKDMNLVFDGAKVHFLIKPGALQISTKNLKEGDRVVIDVKKLKGTTQQMRISDRTGNILGYNPQAKPTYQRSYNLSDPDDAEYLARIFGESSVEDFKKGDFSRYESRGGRSYAEQIARANIVNELPKTPEQKLEGRVSDYTLQTDTVYHGSSAENTQKILKEGFKAGSELPRDAFRGGGYDAIQNSISFSTDPAIASNFTGSSPQGVVFEVKLNPDSKVVVINGIDYAEDLNEFVPTLRKQGIDAVYLQGEKEVAVINKKMIEGIVSHKEFEVRGGSKEIAKHFKTKTTVGGNLGFNPTKLYQPESKTASRETNKIIKQSEIAKTLSEKLGVPIRRGKFRHGKAIGIYKPNAKVVRIKSGGLNTIFHEVAHYLDDTIGFSDSISVDERKKLMSEYGASYEGQPDKQKKEAFAEYLRYRMTGQTEKIAQWGPEFDKVFNEKIKGLPDVEEVIKTATDDFARWNDQPSSQKILSQISIGGEAKTPFTDRVTQTMHDLYTSVLDDLHPLSEFSKIAKQNLGSVEAIKDPYVLARNLRGWVGKADLFLNNGTFGKEFWAVGPDGKIKMNFTGKSYSEIMKPVEKMGALDDFRVYIIAQRIVNDLAPRNIKTGIDVKDAQKAIEEMEAKHPEFPAIATERREFKNRLLEYAKENGVIGEDGLKKMRELNKFHVPFYRVMESSGAKFLGKSKIAGNLANPIKKIKGSEREIIDPLESDVKDVYALVNAAERNNIGVAMANIAAQNFELGRLFEEVSKPMKPVKVNVKEVLDAALKNTDLEGMDIPEELASVVVNLFRTTHATGPNMLNVNMGDKQKVFEVDSDLFKAIQGLEVEDVGIVMKILSAPAKLLRAGATLSPDFSVRNPLRDQFTAFAYSKNGFIPGVDLVRGMFELFKKGDTYNLWKAGGGEHAMFVSLDRQNLQESLKDVLSDPNLKDTVIDLAKNPVKLLQVLSELGEAGTRLGEMRNALARGVNPVEAAFASRNITLDFSRIGTKTRAINAIVAFFNANIQGTDAMIRNFKERPFQTLWKVLLGITLPSILLYLANRKDPRWKEIPQWQKNLFWIVMTPDHIYRIPKPFELGVLFGSVPERAMEVMDTKDPKVFDDLGNTIANGFTPGFLPTALIPIIENITNYSFFLERPIVSPGKENLPPGEQAGPYTTEVSKLLGKALNYSPAKIDNLVSGYSGGLGKYAMSIMDKALLGTGVAKEPPQPATKFEDLPVIKAFMVREPIGSGSESVNRIYEMYGSSTQELNLVKKYIKEGDNDKALEYVKSHPDAVDAIVLTQVVNTFSDFNKAIDMIRQSEDLSPEEKTARIDQIQRAQTTIAAQVLEKLKAKK